MGQHTCLKVDMYAAAHVGMGVSIKERASCVSIFSFQFFNHRSIVLVMIWRSSNSSILLTSLGES